MTALLLAAFSAAVYGSADYCGGVATRRAHPVTVTALSQAVSIPFILVTAWFVGGTPGVAGIGWGVVAGIAGVIGLVLLYHGLASGAMTVVAPTTAVTAALVPLLVGLALERWPRPLALVGVGCAVVAIGLVSLVRGGESPAAGRGSAVAVPRIGAALLASAVAAGVAFGVFFVALDRAGSDAGLWPLVAGRLTSVTLGLLAAALASVSLRTAGVGRLIVAVGILDVTANALYLLAAQLGKLAIVAPVAALYPVSTVLLALTIDKERLRPIQLVGLGLAATALVLVTGSA